MNKNEATNIQKKYNLTPETLPVDYADILLPITKICRVKMNAVPSEIGAMEQYEGITFRSSTRWFVLSVLQDLQSTGDPLSYVYIHIKWTLSIITTINEFKYTACRKVT